MGCAVITGAGGALGGAIARRLASDGMPVVAVDVDGAAAEATAEAIRSANGRASASMCDLRSAEKIGIVFERAVSEFGSIDVLVNNAAVFPSGRFVDVPVDTVDDTMAVNHRAYFLCAQHAARSMIRDGSGGTIVNVASIVWHGFWSEMSPYVAAKGAVIALTRALARELGVHEIRVNAVAPGAFPTAAERAQHDDMASYEALVLDSQALKRRGTFDELAAAVSFLAGPESSFVTGQTLNVDGGWVMS
jgi:NAD(P)-dependent dehydrogenase (short-subunit alcohol dehydrogenase family)